MLLPGIAPGFAYIYGNTVGREKAVKRWSTGVKFCKRGGCRRSRFLTAALRRFGMTRTGESTFDNSLLLGPANGCTMKVSWNEFLLLMMMWSFAIWWGNICAPKGLRLSACTTAKVG